MDAVSHVAYRDGLDWVGFRDLYYANSRRHDLRAIVAYGVYKNLAGPQPASEAARLNGDVFSKEAVPLDVWEDEGGTSH